VEADSVRTFKQKRRSQAVPTGWKKGLVTVTEKLDIS
jgi:hypothetical protein